MKNIKLATLFSVVAFFSSNAMACGSEPYVGEVCTFAFNYCPEGFVPANGQSLEIFKNQVLFAVIGTEFGGDVKFFRVPDLGGKSIIGTGVEDYIGDPVFFASHRGEKSIKLQKQNIPPLTIESGIVVSTDPGTLQVPENGSILAAGDAGGGNSANIYISAADAKALPNTSKVTLGYTSQTSNRLNDIQPIPTIPPQVALTQCIATKGVYPMRP